MDIIKYLEKTGYKVEKKIGSGSFGKVYKGTHIVSKNEVAIKIEKAGKNQRLTSEKNLYSNLNGIDGLPQVIHYKEYKSNIILIMTLLGPSLDDLYKFCNNKFDLKTVTLIALQILDRIENIHNKNILHRDIKPDNFLIGIGNERSKIYIIDFGLSKKFIDNDNNHTIYKKSKNFTGSFRYSSIRNHKGIEQSRRDDLESIGYMLIHFIKGRLPWQGLKGSTKKERSKNIYKVKRNTTLEELCEGLPPELYQYMKYSRLLRFSELPDYEYLRSLFLNIIRTNNMKINNLFSWNIHAKKIKNVEP